MTASGSNQFSVGQHITQYQTPFCIRIQYFNSLPQYYGGENIAWAIRFTIRHVLCTSQHTYYIDGRSVQPTLSLRPKRKLRQYVIFHLIHAIAGLEKYRLNQRLILYRPARSVWQDGLYIPRRTSWLHSMSRERPPDRHSCPVPPSAVHHNLQVVMN